MNKPRRKPEDDGPGVPTWIVSFSDMITLLLSFFVLLQVFAHDRDPGLFFVGQGSFRRAIKGLGIPDWLYGKENKPRRQYVKAEHSMDEDKDKQARRNVLDAEDDKIRRAFDSLKKMWTVQAADRRQEPVAVVATPIRFGRSSASLDRRAKEFLTGFARSLAQNVDPSGVEVYLIGLAAEERDPKRQWMLSAQRAAAAEEFVREIMSSEIQGIAWRTCSWGVGAGGQWCHRHGIIPEQTSIAIVVMGRGDRNGG